MNIKDNKKILILGICTLLVFVLTTFAYFAAQINGVFKSNATVVSEKIADFKFNVDKELNIVLTQDNMSQGNGDVTDTSIATAYLTSTGKNVVRNETYSLYIDINNNTFNYTTEEKTSEMLLQITGPDGKLVRSIEGLNYLYAINANGEKVAGFDITNVSSGRYFLARKYKISSFTNEAYTEHNWVFKVVFVNLDSNQSENRLKQFNATVEFSKENNLYHEDCNDTTLACTIAKKFTTQGANGLNFLDGYNTATTDYTGASVYLPSDVNDYSYRYTGTNPDNYVCFGYDDATGNYAADWCPPKYLYRIIGIIGGKVKLVSSEFLGSDIMGTTSYTTVTNNASYPYKGKITYSSLPAYAVESSPDSKKAWENKTIYKTVLNKNYLEKFDNSTHNWTDMMETSYWYTGFFSNYTNVSAYDRYYYDKKFDNPDRLGAYVYAKVGLISAVDVWYSRESQYWGKYYTISYQPSQWIHLAGTYEMILGYWYNIINSINNTTNYSLGASSFVSYLSVSSAAIRPSFYLKSEIQWYGGTGTSSNPYRVVDNA